MTVEEAQNILMKALKQIVGLFKIWKALKGTWVTLLANNVNEIYK
jgi:hypothetical protein